MYLKKALSLLRLRSISDVNHLSAMKPFKLDINVMLLLLAKCIYYVVGTYLAAKPVTNIDETNSSKIIYGN